MRLKKLVIMMVILLSVLSYRDVDAKKKPYTKEDVYYLSRIINSEAGNVSKRCQKLVGVVVVKRRNHKLFPNTIKEVALAPNQYACVNTTRWYQKPSKSIIKMSKKLLKEHGTDAYPNDLVYQANFIQGTSVYETVDGVYFCRH